MRTGTVTKALVALLLFVGSVPASAGDNTSMSFEKLISGEERPHQIPENWVGRPTESAKGWRWDDPNDAGNSVRIFAGDPNSPSPSKRQAYVIVISGGTVIGRDGKPMLGNVEKPE
jgi:hypothetical protein